MSKYGFKQTASKYNPLLHLASIFRKKMIWFSHFLNKKASRVGEALKY